jgi:hypothetical protein
MFRVVCPLDQAYAFEAEACRVTEGWLLLSWGEPVSEITGVAGPARLVVVTDAEVRKQEGPE